tara:strand:- start:1139 stop:1882 length:744 start_codon:yes stop_codon:yes gene_type:complete
MSLSEKNIREREFHNKLHSEGKTRFEDIFYKALFNLFDDFFNYLKNHIKNKDVLEYGCGIGSVTEKVINYEPKNISGIDISDQSISIAKKRSEELNLNIQYQVQNCEETSLSSESFDIIYGSGILHHLDLKKSIRELNRLLKVNGSLVFMEPLGTNPLINLYRKFTPKSRTIDEHPLTNKDFDFIKNTLGEINIRYYGFMSLVLFIFYRNSKKSIIFKLSTILDNWIFKIKFLRFLAWSVLIVAKKS